MSTEDALHIALMWVRVCVCVCVCISGTLRMFLMRCAGSNGAVFCCGLCTSVFRENHETTTGLRLRVKLVSVC